MSNIAEFQKTGIITFNKGFPGDISTPQYLPGQMQAAVCNDPAGVNVGTFVWQEVNSNAPFKIVQAKGSNIYPLGFVIRSNQNVSATLGITDGYTNNISQNQTVAVCKFGSVFCTLTTVIGTNPVTQWSNVYINNTTGVIGINAGGTLTGWTKLNWLFKSPSTELVANGVVEIQTNDQNTQVVA